MRLFFFILAFGFIIYLLSRSALPGKNSRLIAPAAAILLFLFFVNLLAYLIPFPYSFFCALGLVLAIAAGLRKYRPNLNKPERIPSKDIIYVIILIIFFGLFIHATYKHDPECHYPLISTISCGNLPVKNINDPTKPLDYHYGFDIWAAAIKYFLDCDVEEAADLATFTLFLATLLLVFGLTEVYFQGDRFYSRAALLLFFLGFGFSFLFPFLVHPVSGSQSFIPFGFYKIPPDWDKYYVFSRFRTNHSYLNLFVRRPGGLAYMLFPFIWLMFHELCLNKKQDISFSFWIISALTLMALAAEELFVMGYLTLGVILIYHSIEQRRPDIRLLTIMIPILLLAVLQGGVLSSFFFVGQQTFRAGLLTDITFKWPPYFLFLEGPLPIFSPIGFILIIMEYSPFIFIFPLLLLFRRNLFHCLLMGNFAIGIAVPLLFQFGFSSHDLSRLTFMATALAHLFAPAIFQDWRQRRPSRSIKPGFIILVFLSIIGTILYGLFNIAKWRPYPPFYQGDRVLEAKLRPYVPKNSVVLGDPRIAESLARIGYLSIYKPQKSSYYFLLDHRQQADFISHFSADDIKHYRIEYLIIGEELRSYLSSRYAAALQIATFDYRVSYSGNQPPLDFEHKMRILVYKAYRP